APALNGQFRTGQIIEIFRLQFRQQHRAFIIIRKLVQLLADFGQRFRIIALTSLGASNRIERTRLDLHVATVEQVRKWLGEEGADVASPEDGKNSAASYGKNDPKSPGRSRTDQHYKNKRRNRPLGYQPTRVVLASFHPTEHYPTN